MNVSLTLITKQDLVALAKGETPPDVRALPGALPPPFVAARAVEHIRAGKSATWCSTFYIHNESGAVVGGCGFKDAPECGEVEIGYAVAPARRSFGIGTLAVQQLLAIAEQSAEVHTVVATINPHNLPSIRVAQKLGFAPSKSITDADGEELVRWCRSTAPNNSLQPTQNRYAVSVG